MYTKFKAWKQAKVRQVSETADEKTQVFRCAQTTMDPATERFPAPALKFVNTSHPQDATSVKAIGSIRSHVAKEIHATRRHRKKCAGRTRHETDARLNGSFPFDYTTQTFIETEGNLDTEPYSRYESKPRRQQVELPGPITLLDTARRDQLNSLARPLNDAESFLIDHYLTVIGPEAFSRNSDSQAYFSWVPFALSDTGLLSAILLITCRCVLLNIHNWRDSPYVAMAEHYRGDCLRSIINALAEEGSLVSGTTMARVMVMCNYELKFGDNRIARCHANAISRMVELKGGMQRVSSEDYLGGVIARFCARLDTWQDNTTNLRQELSGALPATSLSAFQ